MWLKNLKDRRKLLSCDRTDVDFATSQQLSWQNKYRYPVQLHGSFLFVRRVLGGGQDALVRIGVMQNIMRASVTNGPKLVRPLRIRYRYSMTRSLISVDTLNGPLTLVKVKK